MKEFVATIRIEVVDQAAVSLTVGSASESRQWRASEAASALAFVRQDVVESFDDRERSSSKQRRR